MPRPDPLTALTSPDHWMVVQFGDSPAYVAEGPEFRPRERTSEALMTVRVPAFATAAAAQAAIRTAQSMATNALARACARINPED